MYGFNFLGINAHDNEHYKDKPNTNESSINQEDLEELKNKIEELKTLKEFIENSGISEVTSDIEHLKDKVEQLTTDVSENASEIKENSDNISNLLKDNDSPEIDSIPEVYNLLNDYQRGETSDKMQEVSKEDVEGLFKESKL